VVHEKEVSQRAFKVNVGIFEGYVLLASYIPGCYILHYVLQALKDHETPQFFTKFVDGDVVTTTFGTIKAAMWEQIVNEAVTSHVC